MMHPWKLQFRTEQKTALLVPEMGSVPPYIVFYIVSEYHSGGAASGAAQTHSGPDMSEAGTHARDGRRGTRASCACVAHARGVDVAPRSARSDDEVCGVCVCVRVCVE
jgi:hypothetical protein